MTNTLILAILYFAIAQPESGNNPNAVGPGGERGRCQISSMLLDDYNKAHGLYVTMDMVADDRWGWLVFKWRLGKCKTIEDCCKKWHGRHCKAGYIRAVTEAYRKEMERS